MREIRDEIEIDAPPERMWEVLTDFDSYPEWNPFVTRISGRVERGARLDVRIVPPGTKGMGFNPRVIAAEPRRELAWLGRVLARRQMNQALKQRVERGYQAVFGTERAHILVGRRPA